MAKNQISGQVFIGGCSRSGTTLLGSMLGGHNQFICTPESHFKIDVLRLLNGATDDIDGTAVFKRLSQHWRYKIWELAADDSHLAQELDGCSYADLLNWLITQYTHSVGRSQAITWVDHTPENISYAMTLHQLFPNAKFIHIVRDGRGVAASIIPLDWGPNSIVKAARWWVRMVSFGLAAERLLPPSQIAQVKYEDLVTDPEQTLRRLCDFLEVPFAEEMLQATGFKLPQYTLRQHTLVGSAPNPATATRWQQRLSARDVEIFENQTRDYLAFLGYPMQYGLNAKPPNFMEVQKGKNQELIRGEFINKIKWLIRSYPLWLSRDFFSFAKLSDTNN